MGLSTLAAASTSNLKVVGTGIPAGVSGVIVNITATKAARIGYLTVFPAGVSKPNTSNVSFQPLLDEANEVTVKVGPGNTVSIFATSRVDVMVDVMGYVTG